MKQGIVKFSKEFVDPNTGLKEWYGYEGPVDELMETDKIQQAFKNAKEQVIAAKGYPNLLNPDEQNFMPPSPPPIIQKQPEDRSVGLTPELMASCEDVVTLQTFYLLVDRSKDIELKQVYKKRMEELVAKESKEIINTTETLSHLINESGLPYESLDNNK